VAIVIGSDSDWEVVRPAVETLKKLQVPCELRVISAHRTPERLREYVSRAADSGVEVFIAAAGAAAHLPGVIASMTLKPVIGVPVPAGTLGGLDALLSIVQMPAGIPVATVAIGQAGARNAALLAAQIIARTDPELLKRLEELRCQMAQSVAEKDSKVQQLVREL
jgi:5-(carboxyamino)imidazole ribonucleotide mutase